MPACIRPSLKTRSNLLLMRAGIENWLSGHWYSSARPPWYLRLLESVYQVIFQHRQQRAADRDNLRSGDDSIGVPLIIIGNITVGGTGKTSLLIGLCRIARELNLKPGIISKGYARRSRLMHDVFPDSSVEMCGDEPVLLAKRCASPVVVARDRLSAANRLCELGVDLIFSDDGLQQADLPRSMEFCVVDGVRGLGNGHMLPAGPLREPVGRLKQVDQVIINGCWPETPEELATSIMQLQPLKLRSLDELAEVSASEFRQKYAGQLLHAVAGIGHPQQFFSMLEGLGFEFEAHSFADHHAFIRQDFDKMGVDETIVMTEKDTVKCRHLELKNAWYLPVETQLQESFELQFKAQLMNLVKSGK